jgi:surface protein
MLHALLCMVTLALMAPTVITAFQPLTDASIKRAVTDYLAGGLLSFETYGPISQWNTTAVTDMTELFSESTINEDIGNWDTAKVTSMRNMFKNASAFNQPIGTWNTAAVTNMYGMFDSASAFNQPIGTWITAAVTDMESMFNGASEFNQDIGTWNTAAVTNMSHMFFNASAFNQPIGTWTTTAVTKMDYMFSGASAFNQDIGKWDTAKVKVTDMVGMFHGASAFNQPICWPRVDDSTVYLSDTKIGESGTLVDGVCFKRNTVKTLIAVSVAAFLVLVAVGVKLVHRRRASNHDYSARKDLSTAVTSTDLA